MYENILFNKIYKNKRYLKKLFEGDKWGIQIKALNDTYKKLVSDVSSFSVNSYVYTSMPGVNTYQIFYFYPNILLNMDTEEYDTEEQIKNDIIQFVEKSLKKDMSLPKSSNTELYSIKWNHKASRYLIAMPCKVLELNIRNLTYNISNVGFYKNLQNIKFNGQMFIDNIKKNLRISQTDLSDLINLIIKHKEERENILYEKEKIDTNNSFDYADRLKTYSTEEINYTNEDTPKNKNMINLMTFKDNPNKVRPFIYTKEIVSDDLPRHPDTACKMLLNNVNQLLNNLQSSPKDYFILTKNNDSEISKIEESLNYNDNILLEYRVSSQEKINKKVNSNKETKKALLNPKTLKDVYNTSIRTCNVYKEAFENARKKDFNSDYFDSQGLNYNTHLYLVELLSPLVVVANKCVWQSLAGKDGFKELQKITGTNGNDFWNNKTYIGYYTQSNEPLADSFIFINNKKIQISTKGGANGAGAAASITSLRNYIYDYYGDNSAKSRIKKYNQKDWELTPLGERVKKIYPNEFQIFEIISTISFDELKISQFKQWINEEDIHELKNMKEVIEYINNTYNFTDFIMEILQSASFDFAQVNAKASSTADDFHFDFTVHYPAVFSGTVKIEAPINNAGFTKFHIYG